MIRNILEYLEYDARQYPGKTAVIDEQKSLTYGELLLLSRQIGSALAEKIKIRTPVPVLMEKSADTLCAFLGIVQAGCFYILLNPEFPQGRLRQILDVLQAEVLITDREHKEQAEELFGEESTCPSGSSHAAEKLLVLEDLLCAKEDGALLDRIREEVIDADPLYANFTSGSTGVPKGVVVSQRSVLDFIEIFTPMFSIDETDIVGNQAPFDFDVSVKDIYASLKAGATLVIIPKALFSQPTALLDFICEHGITTMIWAVSALCLISTFHGLDYRSPECVRRVLFSGEVMPLKHLRIWMEHLPRAQFVNLYGPTEITCNCTYHLISREREYADGIPIGRPFPNEHVFLLGEDGTQIRKAGETGEICVRGTALALGYYRNSQQTETAFPDNPLHDRYPERIYRTGDLGKYTEDGELMFCGRKDFQVKYLGHRIELEEIERAVSDVPGVERCCVLFHEARQRLTGYYTGTIERKELHGLLQKRLPVYMIPGTLRQIEAFPLTKNGKIDRRRLSEQR